jgi:hypothetical protein
LPPFLESQPSQFCKAQPDSTKAFQSSSLYLFNFF